MSNNIDNLAAKTFSFNEISETIEGFKFIALVDRENKRKSANSIPTLILNDIEANPETTVSDIVKRISAIRSKAITAKRKEAKEKGKSFPDFLKGRIIAVSRYYLNPKIREDFFSGLSPLIKEGSGPRAKYSLGYTLIPNPSK